MRTLLDKSDFGSKRFKELQHELNKTNTDLKKFDATVNQHQRNVGNYGSFLNNIKAKYVAIGGAITGLIALTAGVTRFFKNAVTGAMEDERQEHKLLFAVDQNISAFKRLIELRDKYKKTTVFTEDEIYNALNMVAALGRGGDEAEKFIETAMGLSRAIGVDLEGAMLMLSGTLEGNKGRFGKLSGAISNMTEEQLKAGDAIDVLNEKFGKFATEGMDSVEGKAKNLGKVWEDISDGIGEILLPAVNGVIEKFKIISDFVNSLFSRRYVSMTPEEMAAEKKFWDDRAAAEKKRMDDAEALRKSKEEEAKKAKELEEKKKKWAEEEKKRLKEEWDAILKNADEQGKLYEKTIQEREKLEESAYKLSKDLGITTYQEVYDYELKKILESAEYRLLIEGKTAEEIIAIRKAISDRAAEEASKYPAAGLPSGIDEKMPEFAAGLDDMTGSMTTSLEEWFAENEELLDEINMWAQMFGNAMTEVFGMITEANRREMEIQMQDIERRYQFEQDALQRAYDNNLISKSEYDKKSKALDKKKADEQEKLRRENAKKQQTIAILQAIVNTALGVTGALASGWTVAEKIIGAILIAALGIAEIATISSVKYAKGGHFKVGKEGRVLKGKSHAEGGVRLSDIEAEGGEYVGVINKQSTRKYGDFLPLVMDSLNRGNFENVFSPNLMVIPETRIQKKMLDVMTKPKIEKHTYVAGNRVITKIGNQTIITHLR